MSSNTTRFVDFAKRRRYSLATSGPRQFAQPESDADAAMFLEAGAGRD
jgi:hypothetical protein